MEIDISKYFVIHKDKRGKIFAIEQINPKELFEAVTKQNEQLHRYKQALERIKDIVTQINFTVAGGYESPKYEWIRLYRTIVYEVSKIISKVE